MKKPQEPADPPATGPPATPNVRRVLFLHPTVPLTAEMVAARLAEAGIDRSPDHLRALSDLELLLVYDYVERLFRSASSGKVQPRPRPLVLDAMPWYNAAAGIGTAP